MKVLGVIAALTLASPATLADEAGTNISNITIAVMETNAKLDWANSNGHLDQAGAENTESPGLDHDLMMQKVNLTLEQKIQDMISAKLEQ